MDIITKQASNKGIYLKFKITLFFLFIYASSSAVADESFLSNDEYAKMLYKNPRGIGCNLCHGEYGEGKEISSYISSRGKVSIMGPNINKISMRRFLKALEKGNGLMPEYFLTKQEKAYLYYYISNQKNLKVSDVDKKK